MKRAIVTVILSTVLFTACNPGNDVKPTSASRLVPEPDIAERLQYQKSTIDSLFLRNKDQIEVFVKHTGDVVPMLLKDTILSEEAETTFSVLRDSLKNIIAITESPYSQSGDWHLTLTHYFDKNENTFAFEKQTNFFNSGCTEGVAYETQTQFFDNSFKSIRKDYKLVNKAGDDLIKDSCSFMYSYEHRVHPNLNNYLNNYRLQADR